MYFLVYCALAVGVIIGFFIAVIIASKMQKNKQSKMDIYMLDELYDLQNDRSSTLSAIKKATKPPDVSGVMKGTQSAREEGACLLYKKHKKETNNSNEPEEIRNICSEDSENRERSNMGSSSRCNIVIRYQQQPDNSNAPNQTDQEILQKPHKTSNTVSYRNIRYTISFDDSGGTNNDSGNQSFTTKNRNSNKRSERQTDQSDSL